MDSLTTMPIITTTWMTTKMSIMPIVSIVTIIRININLHIHHVDHAQAEKDAAMKQAESASRAAEMFMKVFIVRYKLNFNLTHHLLETFQYCFSKIKKRPYPPRTTIRMEALETALALVMLVRKQKYHAMAK